MDQNNESDDGCGFLFVPTRSRQPKPPLWKRGLRFVIVRTVFWYVVICLVLMFLQRSLIYRPDTTEKMPLSEALLAGGVCPGHFL